MRAVPEPAQSPESPLERLIARVARHAGAAGDLVRPASVPDLVLMRADDCQGQVCAVYEPLVALVVQGRKQVAFGDETLVYDPQRYFVTPLDLPGRSVVLEASAQRPFLWLALLRRRCAEPLRTEDLARAALMSVSSLHQHFKALTGMSPLQFQKQLRLGEARRLMLSEHLDAASAAYRVGYESASQFSREYARQFGAPPMRDIAAVRQRGGAMQALP